MKKLVLPIILAILMLSVIACEKVASKKLTAPQVQVYADRLEWDTVLNATAYQIVTDKTITITNTVFYFNDYRGEIKIKCLGDGNLYSDSDYALVEI